MIKIIATEGRENIMTTIDEVVVVPTRVEVEEPRYILVRLSSVKTQMCDSVLNDNHCPHGEMCRFAHSVDELAIHSCRYGENCNNKDTYCKFKHPKETRENYFARNGISPERLTKKSECTNKTCTKVCNSVIQGFQCRHKACNFAHSPEELNVRSCTFLNCRLVYRGYRGKVCNVDCRNRCSFFHQGETKESFFARICN